MVVDPVMLIVEAAVIVASILNVIASSPLSVFALSIAPRSVHVVASHVEESPESLTVITGFVEMAVARCTAGMMPTATTNPIAAKRRLFRR